MKNSKERKLKVKETNILIGYYDVKYDSDDKPQSFIKPLKEHIVENKEGKEEKFYEIEIWSYLLGSIQSTSFISEEKFNSLFKEQNENES